ncbi:MAG: hypothetical protein LR011_02525 [Verrucomicrobia bacterium]|nr:hypothetical protein [Verrucomicrobiota bacterium]
MKHRHTYLYLLVMVFISLTWTGKAGAADGDVSGLWLWTAPVATDVEGVVTMQVTQDGDKINGALKSDRREGIVRMKDGLVDGQSISFNIQTRFDESVIQVFYKGTVEGNRILGTYSVPEHQVEMPWMARRKAEKSPSAKVDPSGTWKWTTQMRNQERTNSLVIERMGENWSGRISGFQNDTAPVGKIELIGNELTVHYVRAWNGREIAGTYVGIINGNTIEGKQTFQGGGNRNERDWTATREPLDIDGEWDWVLSVPEREPMKALLDIHVKEGEILMGTIGTDDWEVPLKDGVLDGRTIRYRTSNPDDTMKFETEGTIEDGRMSGTVTFEYEGNPVSLPWKATRK